jgi:hypothetical protein
LNHDKINSDLKARTTHKPTNIPMHAIPDEAFVLFWARNSLLLRVLWCCESFVSKITR